MQEAQLASHEDNWEMFKMGLEVSCRLGWCEATEEGQYAITEAGRQHALKALEQEALDHAAGRLTSREASSAHTDLIDQHVLHPHHALAYKLWSMAKGEPADEFTAEEEELLVAHVQVRPGPSHQELINKLHGQLQGQLCDQLHGHPSSIQRED